MQWDRSVDGILWSTDSTYLVAGASDQGRHKLWTVSVPGGRVEELVSTGHNINPSWSQWGGLFYLKVSSFITLEAHVQPRLISAST